MSEIGFQSDGETLEIFVEHSLTREQFRSIDSTLTDDDELHSSVERLERILTGAFEETWRWAEDLDGPYLETQSVQVFFGEHVLEVSLAFTWDVFLRRECLKDSVRRIAHRFVLLFGGDKALYTPGSHSGGVARRGRRAGEPFSTLIEDLYATYGPAMSARAFAQLLHLGRDAYLIDDFRGYVPWRAPGGRNAELEAAIISDPEEPSNYLVYADWLQMHGDPRGELIAVQNALSEAVPDEQTAILADPLPEGLSEEDWRELEVRGAIKPATLGAAESGLLHRRGPQLLGPLLDFRRGVSLRWKRGFIDGAFLFLPPDAPITTTGYLDWLFALPAAAALRELHVTQDDAEYWATVRLLERTDGLQALRILSIGDHVDGLHRASYSLARLYPAIPRLEELRVRGEGIVLGDLHLPTLKTLWFDPIAVTNDNLFSIFSAEWDELETLYLSFGDSLVHVPELQLLLNGTGLPKLKTLRLVHTNFTNELASALADSRLLQQLDVLDLSNGTLTDEGAQSIDRRRELFAHLKSFYVQGNPLSQTGLAALSGLRTPMKIT